MTGDSNNTCTTVKYDSDGNQQWAARFSDTDITQSGCSDIAVDADGNVIVTGYGQTASTARDYLTAKLSASDGSVIWSSLYNGYGLGYNDEARALVSMISETYM